MQQHENLCRAYFKDVRKSGRTIREDWPEYWDYARRRGSIYGTVVGLNPHTGTKRSTASTAEMFSEHDRQNLATAGEEKGARSPSPRVTSASPGNTNTAVGTAEPPRSTTPFSLSGRTPTLFKRASRAPTVIPRSQAIARQDLIASAERIFYRYLSPAGTAPGTGESHEIYLPPALRVHAFPLSSGHEPKSQTETSVMAQVPDMFHAQKEYCYRAMEQDAFPRFLRAKAFGNLTPVSALVRLIAGLIILWIGLATGFSLIFLDVEPKSKRFFVSIFHQRGLVGADGLSLGDRVQHDCCVLDGAGCVLIGAHTAGGAHRCGLAAAEVAEERLGHPEESNVGLVAVEVTHAVDRRAVHRHPGRAKRPGPCVDSSRRHAVAVGGGCHAGHLGLLTRRGCG